RYARCGAIGTAGPDAVAQPNRSNMVTFERSPFSFVWANLGGRSKVLASDPFMAMSGQGEKYVSVMQVPVHSTRGLPEKFCWPGSLAAAKRRPRGARPTHRPVETRSVAVGPDRNAPEGCIPARPSYQSQRSGAACQQSW